MFYVKVILELFILTFILISPTTASLTKHPKSNFWTACYTDRDGKQVKRSTKSSDRSKAYRIAIELEAVEKKARSSALTTAQLEKVFYGQVDGQRHTSTLLLPARTLPSPGVETNDYRRWILYKFEHRNI